VRRRLRRPLVAAPSETVAAPPRDPLERFEWRVRDHELNVADEPGEGVISRGQVQGVLGSLGQRLADHKYHACAELAQDSSIDSVAPDFLARLARATGSRSTLDSTLIKNGRLAIIELAREALKLDYGRRGGVPALRLPREPKGRESAATGRAASAPMPIPNTGVRHFPVRGWSERRPRSWNGSDF